MLGTEIKKYIALNELAEPDGILIFGGSEDKEIPVCELRQAFSIEPHIYNRSIHGLSVENATAIYDNIAANLNPETVLLHIGSADLKLFESSPEDFDQKYLQLIRHIKALHKKCRIGVISLKNEKDCAVILELNQHLKYIADSEQCEFGDIATRRVWNPLQTKELVSFVYSTGFVHPLKIKRPLYDLIKILFCSEAVFQ